MPSAVKSKPREFALGKLPNKRRQYPWEDLGVADWFYVPAEEGQPISLVIGWVAQLIRKREAAGDKRRFMAIREERDRIEGVRVVRIK